MIATMNATKIKKKRKIEHRGWLLFFEIVFGLYSVTLIFPMLWLLYNSVKTKVEFFINPWDIPRNLFTGMTNYFTVFKDFELGKMFLHTIFLSVLSPLISLFFHCCTAYAYARHNFKLKGLFYALMITPMLVNIAGTLPTTYKLICDLGIYDNIFLILITSVGGYGFNFLLIGGMFTNISGTYKEAARIDGAGHWRIFLTIYLPMASSLLLPLYILGFIGMWNNYTMPYLYLPSYPTLATGIYRIQARVSIGGGSAYSGDWPKLFATMILSILPVFILFAVFQKRIMAMALGGGVKE